MRQEYAETAERGLLALDTPKCVILRFKHGYRSLHFIDNVDAKGAAFHTDPTLDSCRRRGWRVLRQLSI